MNYSDVQQVAKNTMSYLEDKIKQGMTVKQIVKMAEDYMLYSGILSFWYYGIGAFVFAGEDTVLSISGRDYTPSDRVIAKNDIVTIDLSPQFQNIWGDYSRTLIIEDGIVVKNQDYISNQEFRDGLISEKTLHSKLFELVSPDTTFEKLYFFMNDQIKHLGYNNLDFLGNLGHSIETEKNNRIYIEKGNKAKLSTALMFTFEPHIRKSGSKFGFKMESIYYFKNGSLVEL